MSLRFSLPLALLLLGQAGVSQAALGEAPGASANIAYLATSAGVGYTLRETTQTTGTRVREYVSAGGTVFAVSWEGPFLPDLRELLGAHFDTMTAEAGKAPKAGRSQLVVNRPDLRLFSGGHMRAFTGHAWLPTQLPAGLNADDIR